MGAAEEAPVEAGFLAVTHSVFDETEAGAGRYMLVSAY